MTDLKKRWHFESVLALVVALAASETALAAATPEQKCQQGRFKAAATYASCHQKAMAKLHSGGGTSPEFLKFQSLLGKCRLKYQGSWVRLQVTSAGSGSTCDQPRYVDTGASIIDNLTGLEWEKKTDDGSVHDKDTQYTWTVGTTSATGTVFSTFLTGSNAPSCYGGHCDWRVPTIAELQTIVPQEYPCTSSPCIEAIFGPGPSSNVFSSTSYPLDADNVWHVNFSNGFVSWAAKTGNRFVRAVRGGL